MSVPETDSAQAAERAVTAATAAAEKADRWNDPLLPWNGKPRSDQARRRPPPARAAALVACAQEPPASCGRGRAHKGAIGSATNGEAVLAF